MDPNYYRAMNTVSNRQSKSPLPPIPNPPPQADQRQSYDNWTVYSPQVARGNLQSVDPDDPRMSIGWKESAKQPPLPWGTNVKLQPFMPGEDSTQNDDEPTPRASDQNSSYPYPNLSLPHPTLNHDFRMAVRLNPRISVGPTPFGHRNWISFIDGNWSGTWGTGIVLPGGQDSQLTIADGSARLETNYILETHDNPPAHIVIKTHGWRTGPPEVLAALADPERADSVDPSSYKFRLFIEMETGDERYRDKVNYGMWVGSGMRKGAEVIYDAYRIS